MQNVLGKSILKFYALKHLVEFILEKFYYIWHVIQSRFALLPGKLCSETSQCEYWTWISDPTYVHWTSKKICFLKDKSSGLSSRQGVISGAKNCHTAGTTHCSRINCNPNFISQVFFHFSSFIHSAHRKIRCKIFPTFSNPKLNSKFYVKTAIMGVK